MTKEEFGNKIKSLRLAKGLSQDELAKKCGYQSRSSINKIEMGQRDVSRAKVVEIANALGISPQKLLDDPLATLNADVDKLAARSTGAPIQSHPSDKMVYCMPDNSMMLECIKKNAMLKIKTSTPKSGDIVLVSLQNEMLVRKYTKLDNGVVLLEAANPKYKTSYTSDDELGTAPNQIYGIVKSVTFDL